jgi:MATE family multidrug resistance protein
METQTKELNWEQRPFSQLLRLAWPITVSTISYSVMTLVDTLLMGHLGPAELAGVGLGGTIAFAPLCFSFGLLRGVKTLVAQAIGARREHEVAAYRAAALCTALVLGLVTIAIGQAVAPLLTALSATPAAGHAARTYMHIRNLGAPIVLVYVALREVRYAEGDVRSPMTATVIANVVNIALALLLVFGLKLGVAGAASATVIAHAVEASVLALADRARGWQTRGMTTRHLRELWQIGLPTGLQFSLEFGAFALLTMMISSLSEVQMAAHQIALQVCHFSFLPAYAIGEAASVLSGQAVGARRDDLVLRVARLSLLMAVVYCGACSLVLAVGGQLIVAGFTSAAGLALVARRLLRVAAVFQMFDAANIVARAVLRGSGDVRFAAVIGAATSWALTPPLAWLFAYRYGLGAYGGWLGLCTDIIVGAALVWWRLEGKGWLSAANASRARMAKQEALLA